MKRILPCTLALTMMFGMLSPAVNAENLKNVDSHTTMTMNSVLNDDSLIASIPFDNDLKNDVDQKELIGKGNYSFVEGIVPGNKALRIENGNGNHVSTKQSLGFGEDSFTVSFWYKGDTNDNQVILSNKDFSSGSNAGWAIYTSPNAVKMNLGFPTAKDKTISFGRDTFETAKWRYVTYVVDREKMLASMYIDGYQMAETTLKYGSLDTSNGLHIGSDGVGNLGGNAFAIDELKIWKGAFSSDAVKTNYQRYDVNQVDVTALSDTIAKAKSILAAGLEKGFSDTDFDYLKKVYTTANTVVTTQKEQLFTQETLNYYERELTNAIFIYEKSNKTKTPADLNMIVDSDAEISSNPDAIARVEENFRKELEIFPQADVMFLAGDVTGGNNAIEYKWMGDLTGVYEKLESEGLFENTEFYMIRGNHDMGGAEDLIPEGSAGAWNEETNAYDNHFFNSAYRVKVKGYNIVGFDGNNDNENTSGKAKQFLDDIKKEEDYDPTKPLFVSSHFPVSGTTWSSAWSSGASNNVGNYIANNDLSQVVYMSGHTHYDPTDERSLYQGEATYLEAGSTSYSSYIDGGPYGGYIEGSYINYKTAPRIANFLEVYDTKVILKQYNLNTDEFVGVPFVMNVGEGKDAFTYNKSDSRELIAPQFDEAITIKSFENNELTFTMKQAKDNVRVLEYNVQLINKLTGEVDKSFNSLSLPLDKPFDEQREYKITGVSSIIPYTLRVFTADSMYNRSSQDIDITPEDVNLQSITAPADKTGVAIGAAKTADALGLPKTVSVVTDGGSGEAKVAWDVEASNYDPEVMTVQTFSVNGDITLPMGVENPNNLPLTTSMNVTVNKIAQSQMTATATSEETEGEDNSASNALDGNSQTFWHSKWDKSDVLPQSITVNLGGTYNINQLAYLPRQSGLNGNITAYNVYVSTDGETFTKVASGDWAKDTTEKVATFDPTDASHIKLEATAAENGWVSAAEINVLVESSPSEKPQTVVTGPEKVATGETFSLKMGLNGKHQSLFAQDLTLHYDPKILKLDSITSLVDGFQVIDQKETAPGQIRVMAASMGANVPAKGDLLSFHFTAKTSTQASDKTTISLDNVVIADEQGKEQQVGGASHGVTVSKGNGNVDETPSEPTPTPEPKPTPKPEPTPEPKAHVFKSNVINEENLMETIKTKVEEAQNSNDQIDLADLKGHWAEKNVATFVKLGVVAGFKDGTFRPNNQITRAEFAAIIGRVFDVNGSVNGKVKLKDINNHWAKNEINKLVAAGVITGHADGTFRPDRTISREEMVIILSRIVNWSEVSKDDSKGNFTDMSSISSFAANQIKDAAKAGIISGRSNGTFDPKGNSTRAEALTVILNALQLNDQIKTHLNSLH